MRALIEAAAGAGSRPRGGVFANRPARLGRERVDRARRRFCAGRVLVHGAHDRKGCAAMTSASRSRWRWLWERLITERMLGCWLVLDGVLKRRRPARWCQCRHGHWRRAIASAKLLHRPVACGAGDPIAVETAGANARARFAWAPWCGRGQR